MVTEPGFISAYEGVDMISYMMRLGFKLPDSHVETVQSITNVRDTAVIITDYSVWRARPCNQTGFCLELVTRI